MLLFRDSLKRGSAKPEVVDEPCRSLALAQILGIEDEIDVALRTEITPWASRLKSTSMSVGTWFIKSSRMAKAVPLLGAVNSGGMHGPLPASSTPIRHSADL